MSSHIKQVQKFVDDNYPTMVVASVSDHAIRIQPPVMVHDFDGFLDQLSAYGKPTVSLYAEDSSDGPRHIVELQWPVGGVPAVASSTYLSSPLLTVVAVVMIVVSIAGVNTKLLWNTMESVGIV